MVSNYFSYLSESLYIYIYFYKMPIHTLILSYLYYIFAQTIHKYFIYVTARPQCTNAIKKNF